MVNSRRWSKEQLKLAFCLYCQLPFGKLHSRNSEIVELARRIGRTPSAVAMKLVNFASLDPAIAASGRVGLGNASALDREVWEEFHADWERLALECAVLDQQLRPAPRVKTTPDPFDALDLKDFTGETRRAITEQRMKQRFFRRAVLASYGGRCCMSGFSETRLLVASHIVPWSRDKKNRLNPSNGLCLSALHDKAFDQGLITLADDFRVMVSDQLRALADNSALKSIFTGLQGQPIEMPERFLPQADFLARHRAEVYVG